MNTENILAQMKQWILVLQAAVDAIEGTYEADVKVIVDNRLKERDSQIAELEGELSAQNISTANNETVM